MFYVEDNIRWVISLFTGTISLPGTELLGRGKLLTGNLGKSSHLPSMRSRFPCTPSSWGYSQDFTVTSLLLNSLCRGYSNIFRKSSPSISFTVQSSHNGNIIGVLVWKIFRFTLYTLMTLVLMGITCVGRHSMRNLS